MGATAQSKLERASFFDREASKLAKRDPDASGQLRELARRERRKAIRQLKRRPKKGRTTGKLPGM